MFSRTSELAFRQFLSLMQIYKTFLSYHFLPTKMAKNLSIEHRIKTTTWVTTEGKRRAKM